VKLDGKAAIVTGTSPNIGAGIAEGLADEGARLVCIDLQPENAEQCAEAITRRGGQAIGLVCDVTDEAQVEAAVKRARDEFGGVDILVNNAGILGGESVLEMPLERWTRQIAANLTGAFLCTKHVAGLMVEQGRQGSIIVIVSTAGHQGQAGNIGYSTSKGGLLNFARAAAMDLARHGIRVNSLTPTATDPAESVERATAWGRPPRERLAGGRLDFRKAIPLGQLPSPRHYARAAVFLASDDAEMITGIDLRVDAGAIAKYWPWIPGEG
jgi:NAD(P)-dependent dehydrogenase (short-subunit alcohol dehydrogenase family)